MDLPFAKVRVGERFRPAGATVAERWVRIVPNRAAMNARAIHDGQFRRFADTEMVSLVREGNAGGTKTDLGTA